MRLSVGSRLRTLGARSGVAGLVIALVAAFVGAALAVAPLPSSRLAALVVDMEVTAGRRAQVFINNQSARPLDVDLQLNIRRSYEFKFSRQDLTALRLDPTDAQNAEVRIYGIDLLDRGSVVRRFAPAELRSWNVSGMEYRDEPHVLTFTSISADPMLFAAVPVSVGAAPGSFDRLDVLYRLRGFRETITARPYLPLLLLSPVAIVLGSRRRLPAVLSLLVILMVPLILQVGVGLRPTPDPIGTSVSRAAFLGLSLRQSQLISLVITAFAATLGAVAALAAASRAAPSPTADAARSSRHGHVSVLISWWFALGLILAPDLAHLAERTHSLIYSSDWDVHNLTYWAYLAGRGFVPFRDYWYPYGGQYLFSLNLPTGPLIRWGFDVLLFGVFSSAMWLLAKRRRAWAIPATAILILIDRAELLWGVERYLLAINVVLAYVALADAAASIWRALLLGIAVTSALVFEPPQLLYAVTAVGVICAMNILREQPRSWEALRPMLRPMVLAALSIGVSVSVLAALLAHTAQLRPAVDFYRTLSVIAEYAAIPTTLPRDWHLLDLSLFVIWWPALAVAFGVYERFTSRDVERTVLANTMLALGLLGFIVLQKHFVRPMADQLALYPLVAGFAVVLLAPDRPPRRVALVLGLVIGLFAGSLAAQGRLQVLADLLASSPRRFADFVASVKGGSDFDLANTGQFAPARFRLSAEHALVADLESRVGRPLTLFALSDAPVLYILTGQPPVWMANMFNASPVSEQRRVADWLHRFRPSFVVFRRSQLTHDGIQLVVRVPLVVEAVMTQYVPDGRVGEFDVLRRRDGTETVSLERWLELFGSSIDLGRLPAIIDATNRPSCTDSAVCDEYVVVRTPNDVATGQPALCTFDIGGRRFDVHFQMESGVSTYTIPLSRLWIWKAAVERGARPTIATLPSDARRAGLIKVAMDPERLY